MRSIIPIVFIAAIMFVGCHSPSIVHTQTAAPTVATLPPSRPMLITTFGTNSSADGKWQLEVSETSLGLTRFFDAALSDGKKFPRLGPTPDGWRWRAHTGWFVFLDKESRVWTYDGDRLLELFNFSGKSSSVLSYWLPASSGTNSRATVYRPLGFPRPVPTEVNSRLSEPAQKAIEEYE